MIDQAGPSQNGARLTLGDRLGWALAVICARGCYMDFPIASLKMWLFTPAKLSQLHLFFDETDRQLQGYMTWAWFSDKTEQRWKAGTMDAIHISEWNEGKRLWIIDFVTLPGYTEICVRRASSVFPVGTVAYALARRAAEGIINTIAWERVDHKPRRLSRRRLSVSMQS